ncbi:MAG: hypothetical protein AAGC83_06405 [Pseudomonadota bacterium]
MINLDAIKTKATLVRTKLMNASQGLVGAFLAGIIAIGILSMSLTIGLMVLGLSTLVLLIALPFGGLKGLHDRAVQAAP